MRDVFSEAINSAAGDLAEVLVKKLPPTSSKEALLPTYQQRLDRLVDAPGLPGQLARVRLAAEVSLLFDRAPAWTRQKIIPLFDWSCADAPDVWSARKYSNYIGSPDLFGLTKEPFLALFARNDVSEEDVRTFAEWLTAIVIANQAHQAAYPLTSTEARAALRRAGIKALPSVGHRLAMELRGGTDVQQGERWRSVVGPVFQAIWPLDVELQTSATTYKLTQILMSTGDAFSDAADVVLPFLRPEEGRSYSTIFSITDAPESVYASSPSKMLDVAAEIVGDAAPGSVFALERVLGRIIGISPDLAGTRKFQKLKLASSAQL